MHRVYGDAAYCHSAADRGAEYCDERVCLSLPVCLSVRDHIFETTRPIFAKFLTRVTYAMARSSSGSVVICYVLPVLWTTSYLLIGQGSLTSPPKLKRSALAALGLAINCAQ